MDKQIITKKAVYEVLREYWKQYKAYPLHTIVAFFLPAVVRTLVFFVPPLIIAKLINLFASGSEISIATTGKYVVLFAGLSLLGSLTLWHLLAKRVGTGTRNFLAKKYPCFEN